MSIVLGVMIHPHRRNSYERWQKWRGKFELSPEIRYVTGTGVARSNFANFRVDGRENLPHVAKVTEKSFAWWLLPGNETWRCKTDDDTLIHLDRFVETLSRIPTDGAPPMIFGYLKWRGWEFSEFRACGGVWGNAKTWWSTEQKCPKASGPFPYAVGAMYCLSREARHLLANDEKALAFLHAARRRNDHARLCKTPSECANAPSAMRTWHHEDAGIAANLFRAAANAESRIDYVSTPGHFNDPFAIAYSKTMPNWNSRALWVHGIKRRSLYTHAVTTWDTKLPMALGEFRCVDPAVEGWRESRILDASIQSVNASRWFRMCRFA